VTLSELAHLLEEFAAGVLGRDELQERFTPVLLADPLDVEECDDLPWSARPRETQLLWRLIYLFESDYPEEEEHRAMARRIVACLENTGNAEATLELLPLVLDQPRFCSIAGKHLAGVISRTAFLSVLAESAYPPHVKLWLEYASPAAVRLLCAWLEEGAYVTAVSAFESAPPDAREE
jgi:hypothetical protein